MLIKTILENTQNLIIKDKSKFYTFLIKVNNKEEALLELNKIKEEYQGATHYCYAYNFLNVSKCSDDGEPQGTAGLPILNILKVNNLINVLCVVVRYFGGIKLGSGGLIRIYSKATKEVINKAKIKNIINGYFYNITFDYNNLKTIDYMLKDEIITNTIFHETITYEFLSDKDLSDVLNKVVINIKQEKKDY